MRINIQRQPSVLQKLSLVFSLLFTLFLLTKPVEAFLTLDIPLGGRGHSQLTEDGINGLTAPLSDGSPLQFEGKAINEIVQSNINVDKDDLTVDNPIYHFDNETFVESSELINNLKDSVLDEVLKDSAKTGQEGATARKALGQALHILQDYYTHSNWIERGNSGLNSFLGGEEPLRPGGTNPPPDGIEVCRIVPPIITLEEGDELTEEGAIYSTTGFVDKNGDVCARPDVGKCRHGVPSVCSGLAKDIPFISSSYNEAAELAELATRVYVQQILDDPRIKSNDIALRALLGHKEPPETIVYELNLVRADGAVITPELVTENGGMAVFVNAPNGDFSFAQTELELIDDDPAPSDISYNPGTQTWTLTVPRIAEVWGEETELTADEFWITIINVDVSLDTQYPEIVRESQFEQTAHLIAAGSYSMILPIFSRGSFNPLVVSGDLRSVSSTRSSVISSVPFEITYSVTFRQRGLNSSSLQRVNQETEVVSDNGTVFGPFAFSGSSNDILKAETRIERSPHVNGRSYTLAWNIVSGIMVFEPRTSSTVHLRDISSSGVFVSLLPRAILD